MNQDIQFETTFLETARKRITSIFPAQIVACVEELSEEQLWWRPNESSNSVGNLVLHLSGSLRHFLSRTVGGMDYERNRLAEFSEREHLSKEQVLTEFQDTIEQAKQVFATFDPARLMEATPEPAYNPTIFHLFYNVSLHLATHAGQIIFVTKMLKQGSVNELWIRSYKEK
jgi:uncharacterized damage-inducible protein DinB